MTRPTFSERSMLIVCVLLGAVQEWIARYTMTGDGVSYIDVGDAYFRGEWARAINGYWSPMYSWWLGLALYLFRPSIWWEFIVVHAVNFIIYLVALFSFRFFIHCSLQSIRDQPAPPQRTQGDTPQPLPAWVFLALGYGVFLWSALILVDPGAVTPDLLVAAFLFLIGGLLIDLRRRESYAGFAVFGIFCGLAYLTKAVMFPLGFGLLTVLLFSGKLSRRRIAGTVLAGFFFLAISAPFIAALSKQKGRFTFGDSGRIAYAAMVNPGTPPVHWQGDEEGAGTPLHATRKILDDPPVFEFAQPLSATYPPWYDPSYWNDGAHGVFQLRPQIRVLIQSARNFTKMFLGELGLLAGVGIFLVWGGAPTRRALVSNWPLIVVALFTFGMYSIVLVRTRYVAGFMAWLFVAILAAVRLPRNANSDPAIRSVTLAVLATIVFSVGASMGETAYVNMTVYSYPQQTDNQKTAVGLRQMGLPPGSSVAVIDDGRNDYWARLGKFHIVAEVYSPDSAHVNFWSATEEKRRQAYQALTRAGAKAVVVWDVPAAEAPEWIQIAGTHYYVRLLKK